MTGPARAGDRIRLIRPEFRLSEKHWEKRLQTLLGQTRWLRLATLGLGVLAALLAARLVLSLRRSSPAGGETGAREPAAVAHLFRWPRVEPAVWQRFRSGAAIETTAPSGGWAARYRLAGVFLALSAPEHPEDEYRCAILDDRQTKQQYLLTEGEWLENLRVVRVASDYVVLSDGEHEKRAICRRQSPGADQTQTVAVEDEKPVVLESNRFGNRIGETRWEINREAVMEYYREMMDNPERLAKLFLAMEADRDEEGKVAGYRLNMDVGEREFYTQIGLQQGDIVRRANSMRMTSQRRAEYFIGEFAQGGWAPWCSTLSATARRRNWFILFSE